MRFLKEERDELGKQANTSFIKWKKGYRRQYSELSEGEKENFRQMAEDLIEQVERMGLLRWPRFDEWVTNYVNRRKEKPPTEDRPGDSEATRLARQDLRTVMAACGWDVYGGSEIVLPMNFAWEEGFLEARTQSIEKELNVTAKRTVDLGAMFRIWWDSESARKVSPGVIDLITSKEGREKIFVSFAEFMFSLFPDLGKGQPSLPKDQWISIEDALPELKEFSPGVFQSQYVLVLTTSRNEELRWSKAYYLKYKDSDPEWVSANLAGDVTHWKYVSMP